MPTTSFQNNVDIKDHDGSATGLTLGGTLVTSTGTELNLMDGVTATTAELNTTDLSSVGAIRKLVKISLVTSTMLDGCEQATGTSFPTNALVTGAFVNVNTGHGSTATLDVGTQGTSNDPDGILDAIDIETAGVVVPSSTHTTGLNADYLSATTHGALTHDIEIGTDSATDIGYAIPRPSSVGGDPISVTASGDISGGSADVDLFIEYIEFV